jgi:hypothetical protein
MPHRLRAETDVTGQGMSGTGLSHPCMEFGLRYVAHETFLAGVASHFR